MSPTTLIRWSGLGPLVGGVLIGLFPLLHPEHDAAGYASAAWVPVHFMPNLGMVLLLFGLIGLLARQLEHAGRLGVVGFVVAFLGTALFLMGGMLEMFIFPYLGQIRPTWEEEAPPGGIGEAFMAIKVVFTLGHLILGVATARAGELPRSVGVLLALGAVVFSFGDMVGMLVGWESAWVLSGALYGASLSWFGWALWTGASAQRRAVARVPVAG